MSLAVTILQLLTILPLKLGFVSEVWWDNGAYMLIVILPCPLPRFPTFYLVPLFTFKELGTVTMQSNPPSWTEKNAKGQRFFVLSRLLVPVHHLLVHMEYICGAIFPFARRTAELY